MKQLSSKKKKSSDYPLFSIRVGQETKDELDRLVSEAIQRLEAKLKDDEYVLKNDVVVKALRLGLPKIK
jgi:hypothetical protein